MADFGDTMERTSPARGLSVFLGGLVSSFPTGYSLKSFGGTARFFDRVIYRVNQHLHVPGRSLNANVGMLVGSFKLIEMEGCL
jgi:hypothetical protein